MKNIPVFCLISYVWLVSKSYFNYNSYKGVHPLKQLSVILTVLWSVRVIVWSHDVRVTILTNSFAQLQPMVGRLSKDYACESKSHFKYVKIVEAIAFYAGPYSFRYWGREPIFVHSNDRPTQVPQLWKLQLRHWSPLCLAAKLTLAIFVGRLFGVSR